MDVVSGLCRQHKLLFRAHVKDECKASECSLMCDDFWRLGYQRVIVDPSVRQVGGWVEAVVPPAVAAVLA
jgi:hypothetical protein